MGKIVGYLSHSKPSSLLSLLIIFFASTQLGYHFWPSSALVHGVRIDYLSPTIYFLDLLIVLFLSLQGLTLKARPYWNLVPILLVNLLYSQNPLATLSWSLHLILYYLFIAVLGSDLKGSAQPRLWRGRSDPKGVIVVVLTCSLLFQLALAITQVTLGHSVGGLMYYLGERSIAVGQPAVALGTFMDTVVLRAYGTFSHPNVLAGWAVISLLILLHLKPHAPQGSDLKGSAQPRILKGGEGQTLWVLLTTLIVILTQSRSAGLALFGFIIPFYFFKSLKSRAIYFVIGLLVCWFVIPSSLTPPRSDLSLSQRRTLQGLSPLVIKTFPIFGTGAGASISTYPTVSPATRLLQPDHNSFTLFLSWFGIFGVIAVLYVLRSQFENLRIYDLRFIVPLLPLLLLDHYLLTSPQGLFILLLYLKVSSLDKLKVK